jgi:hypothetical protein
MKPSMKNLVLNKYWKMVNPNGLAIVADQKNCIYLATNGNLIFKVDEDWEKPDYQKYFCFQDNLGNPKVKLVE